MLDHQDGAVHRHAADEIGRAIDVLVAHARHRLIKQHHLGLDRKRGPQLQRSLAAIGDFAGFRVGELPQPDVVQQPKRPLVERVERRLGAPEVERLAALSLQRDTNVFKRSQMRKYRRNLERADEPQPRHISRLQIGDVAPIEGDPPARRGDEFRQHVKKSGLARTVRSDEGMDRPTPNAEGNIADRAEIAEALAEAFSDENIVHTHSRRSAERMRFPPTKAKINQAAGAPLVKPKTATAQPASIATRSLDATRESGPRAFSAAASLTLPSFDCAAGVPSRAPGARSRRDYTGSASSQARSSPGRIWRRSRLDRPRAGQRRQRENRSPIPV